MAEAGKLTEISQKEIQFQEEVNLLQYHSLYGSNCLLEPVLLLRSFPRVFRLEHESELLIGDPVPMT